MPVIAAPVSASETRRRALVAPGPGWIRRALVISCAAMAYVASAQVSFAQNQPEALGARVDRLQRELTTLQMFVFRNPDGGTAAPSSGGAVGGTDESSNPATARLTLRMNELEQQFQTLTGSVEEVSFKIGRLEKRLDDLVKDLDIRFAQMEEKVGVGGGQAQRRGGEPNTGGTGEPQVLGQIVGPVPAPAAPPVQTSGPQQASIPPNQVLPQGTPEQRYEYAFSLMRRADYPNAERSMAAFLQLYPQHPLSCNAAYWLGETYYVRQDYAQAAEVFSQAFQRYPQGCKAPDSLLKLGMSFFNLGEKEAACAAFSQLSQQFPNAASGVTALAARERQRAGCGG